MKKRPEVLDGKTSKVKTSCGSFYLTLNRHEGELFEVIMRLGKSGNCIRSLLESYSVILSCLLQSEIEYKDIAKMIDKHSKGVKCGNPFYHDKVKFESCIDYVAQEILTALNKDIKDEEE